MNKNQVLSENGHDKKREIKALEKQKLTWITDGIIVRVICDKYDSGKMYNKKVLVKNILNDFQFLAVSIETDKVHSDLKESELETVLP